MCFKHYRAQEVGVLHQQHPEKYRNQKSEKKHEVTRDKYTLVPFRWSGGKVQEPIGVMGLSCTSFQNAAVCHCCKLLECLLLQVLMGRKMEEWLRFSVCYWHSFCGTGTAARVFPH